MDDDRPWFFNLMGHGTKYHKTIEFFKFWKLLSAMLKKLIKIVYFKTYYVLITLKRFKNTWVSYSKNILATKWSILVCLVLNLLNSKLQYNNHQPFFLEKSRRWVIMGPKKSWLPYFDPFFLNIEIMEAAKKKSSTNGQAIKALPTPPPSS